MIPAAVGKLSPTELGSQLRCPDSIRDARTHLRMLCNKSHPSPSLSQVSCKSPSEFEQFVSTVEQHMDF